MHIAGDRRVELLSLRMDHNSTTSADNTTSLYQRDLHNVRQTRLCIFGFTLSHSSERIRFFLQVSIEDQMRKEPAGGGTSPCSVGSRGLLWE